MNLPFTKYQATGNDFVLLDNRAGKISLTREEIVRVCDRKFGVGADGLILIEPSTSADFKVNYYNSDGSQSLCGNGSRAAMHFAASLGLAGQTAIFEAYDGNHEAHLLANDVVRLKMNNVARIERKGDDLYLNTGSPHLIRFVKTLNRYPVVEEGRTIRYSKPFEPAGTNVNFVEPHSPNTLFVRTYERGVEDETLSCGTGVTAAALAATVHGYTSPVSIKTPGGNLSVEFQTRQDGDSAEQADFFTDIYLVGPAKKVFTGTLEL